MAAIFGPAFDTVEFLEPITASCRESLSRATGSNWQAPELYADPPKGGDNTALNFSGGFDSLAAYAILENRARLVSLDFGGSFTREKEFFSSFPTITVQTNAREFERFWTFMGIGSILLREFFEADYFAFGSILEASPWHFMRRDGFVEAHPIFKAAGLSAVNPVIGLSEFATTRLAAVNFRDQILESLKSLAAPNNEKYLRKFAMLKYINEVDSLNLDLSSVKPKEMGRKMTLGQSFAADFLACGMANFCPDQFPEWIEAPKGFAIYAQSLDPSFYWTENTGLKTDLPMTIRAELTGRKAGLGIEPYGPAEWDNFREVARLVSVFHKIPGQIM